MTAKRKAKRAVAEHEDLSKPTKWRMQHGEFAPPSHDTDPETGLVVTHHRSVDTLGMMLANGTITQEMHDAGGRFRALFRRAALDSLSSSALVRLPGKTAHSLSDDQIDARRQLGEAIDVLGGHGSAAGSCAWHILGLETSIREWAIRCGWGGRMVTPPHAQGMLVATLSVLAGHFGLSARPRAA
jgi:hypothetical protein